MFLARTEVLTTDGEGKLLTTDWKETNVDGLNTQTYPARAPFFTRTHITILN